MKKIFIMIIIIAVSFLVYFYMIPPDNLMVTIPIKGKPYSIKVYSSVGGATVADKMVFHKNYSGLFNVYMSDTTWAFRIIKYNVKNDTLELTVGGDPKYRGIEKIMKIKIE